MKQLTNAVRRLRTRLLRSPGTRDELHEFWRKPDRTNSPEEYQEGEERSRFVLEVIARHVAPGSKILEIGCNVGRNLDHLRQAGYTDLEGIEISEAAVAAMRLAHPELARLAVIHNAPVEEVISTLPDNDYDAVFTMAVLEHIHPDSEWTFRHMARVTGRVLVTIEDEENATWRHFPRRYDAVFEPLGLRQIEELDCAQVEGLGEAFRARVFSRPGAVA